MQAPLFKQVFLPGGGVDQHLGRPGQERADLGGGVARNVLQSALGDHLSASFTGFRTHFNHPIPMGENLYVMVYQNDRIPICDQVVHDTGQA